MHRVHAASGQYDGHQLINWLNDNRNDELNEIYDLYEDCKDPEMTADQQIGKFLFELGAGEDRGAEISQADWSWPEWRLPGLYVGDLDGVSSGNPRDKFARHTTRGRSSKRIGNKK